MPPSGSTAARKLATGWAGGGGGRHGSGGAPSARILRLRGSCGKNCCHGFSRNDGLKKACPAADLPPPPDLATLEAELKAREEDGGKAAVKRGKKRGGGGEDLGNLGDLTGGSLDAELEPRVKAKPSRAKPKAAKKRAKKKKKDDDFIDDEEDFVDEMSETDEEFDPDEIVPPRETTRSRSGRVVRKRYTDGDDDDESDEEPTKRRTARNVKEEAPMASLDGTGTLAGSLDAPFAGSLAATAGDVGEDEDDYD